MGYVRWQFPQISLPSYICVLKLLIQFTSIMILCIFFMKFSSSKFSGVTSVGKLLFPSYDKYNYYKFVRIFNKICKKFNSMDTKFLMQKKNINSHIIKKLLMIFPYINNGLNLNKKFL